MKRYLYVIAMLLFSYQGIAQTELEQKIKQLETQLEEQTQRNILLKDALDLRELGKELQQENVTIRITTVSQNLENGELTVQGLISYQGDKRRNLQFVQQQIVDPNGHALETYIVVKPQAETEDIFIQNAASGVPYAFLIKFEGAMEKMPTLSLLRVQIYGERPGSISNFDFKGIEVDW